MSAAIRALHPSRCPLCRGPIAKGDTIALHDDQYAHDSCIPSPEPWDTEEPTVMNAAALKLSHIVTTRGAIGHWMALADFGSEQTDALPQDVAKALWAATVAENELFELLNALASEHVGGD